MTGVHDGGLGTVLAVFAHPDDEAYLAGGLMALAVDARRRVVCVTATHGELGFPDDDPRSLVDRADVRRAELGRCLDVLGVTEHMTTIAAGSNGVALPQGTINVASGSGAGFGTYSGSTVMTSAGPQSVFCTGVAATQLTGCSGGTGTMSTGAVVSDTAASRFDVYTISGGKAAVSATSLTILTDVPAADRSVASTVTATANNGLITFVQSTAPTGTFALTYGICATGVATYSAGNASCFTGQVSGHGARDGLGRFDVHRVRRSRRCDGAAEAVDAGR